MGFLKTDYSNVKEGGGFTLLPKGEYEVFPSAFDIEQAKSSGNWMVQFNYKVRDDVEGQEEFGGNEIRFDNFVQAQSSLWRFQAASKAAQLPEGKDYETLEEWASDFKGKPVRVYVEQEETDSGKTVNVVKGFSQSEAGGQAPVSDSKPANDDPFADNGEPIDISDDDLPF